MTRPFESKIKKGFAGVAIILALIAALAIANSRQLHDAWGQAARSQETLRELERLMVTMVDAETGMRGYLLTGEESYLKPYRRGLATIDRRMKHLKELLVLTGVNGQFEDLQKEVNNQIAYCKSLVEKIEADGGLEQARRTVRIDEGKRGLGEIRRIVLRLEQAEEKILAERREKSEIMDRRAVGALLLLVAASVALLVAGLMILRHHLAEREKLEDERHRFFTLSDDLYTVCGMDGFIKEVNPAAGKILGFDLSELKGKPFMDFVHPDDLAATMVEAEKLAHGRTSVYFENRCRAKDGSYRWLLWSAAPLPEEQLFYAVAKDITEHKKKEQRIVELAEESKLRAAELEDLNKELEAFSYSVSHDLRAPLRHIAGFSDMLQRHADGTLDDKGKRYLNTIVESARRMGNLIDDLLVFSRMGRAGMRREKIDLDAMVAGIIEELAPDVGNRRINWKTHKLPEVLGDRAMLKQALLNLISNALKYSSKREVAEIEIGSRDEPDETVFFVRDNGVGFDMAYAHKLFGVFQRLHETSQFEGTGIGLANVRRIIARHGGATWAEAELDKGATFYFSLPRAKSDVAT